MRVGRMSMFAVLTGLALLCGVPPLFAGQPGDPGVTGLLYPPTTHVRAATTGPIDLGNPGTDAFDGETFETTDPAINRRLLVWQQEDQTTNGVYQWNSTSTALTRVTDLNEAREFIPNLLVYVRQGETSRQSFFSLNLDAPPTLGTTSLTFSPVGLSVQALIELLEESVAGQFLVTTDPGTGLLSNPNVLNYPQLLTAEPGPGSCESFKHTMELKSGPETRRWSCPNGPSTNPIEFLGRPSLTTVCVGPNCLHCAAGEPDCQLDIVAGAGLTCELTGAAPVMVVTCTPVSGTKTIWIPAAAMSSSGNCSDPAEAPLITNGPKRYSITCEDNDAASVEADLAFTVADQWNAGTIRVQLYAFSVTNQTTEVLSMDWAGQCSADGAAVATHSTTGEQNTSVTFGNQAADLQISAFSSPITLNGSCNATSMVFLRGQVNATGSTYAPFTDLRILGIKVEFTQS